MIGERLANKINLEKKIAQVVLFSKFKKFNKSNPYLIFSEPRGGSTWLAETLVELPKTALIWEPLHLKHVKSFRELNFGWRQYIPQDSKWAEAEKVFTSVFKGKTLNEWTLLKTSFEQYRKSEQLLIKFCRGNALLPWLCNTFQFQKAPIFLVRHPFAVTASQLKQGGWNYKFSGFDIPKGSFSDYYLQHINFLNTLQTKEEALVASWCLSNKPALDTNSSDRKWLQITYEELLLEPNDLLTKVLKEWGKPMSENIYQKLGKISSTAIKGSPVHNKKAQLTNWQNEFNSNQIKKMQRVLDYFEINLYSSEPLPKL